MELLLIPLGILALFAIYVIVLYNNIVRGANLAKRAWATVVTWQRKELRALEMMSEKMREYADFEKTAQTDIAKLRQSVANLDGRDIDVDALKESANLARSIIAKFDARREAYPELKANKLYIGYMKEVSESEAQVAASISVFNHSVESYNNTLQLFPNNAFNAMFFKKAALREFSDTRASKEFDYAPNI